MGKAAPSTAGATLPPEAAKVFISYSRRDAAFADDLLAGLKACGFEAYIDREDIAAGEAWEARLGALIGQADTVVYVISPASVTSPQCHWEVTETLRLSKRLLPVVWQPVPEADIPAELARLNFVFFDGRASFAKALAELAAALRVDAGWIREHSRIGELARRWDARGRPGEALLRGEELDSAREWAASRPLSAPALTDLHRDYLAAGLAAREAAVLSARNRRRGVVVTSLAVAIGMTLLAGGAVWQAWQAHLAQMEAQLARNETVRQLAETEAARRGLQAATVRLEADIALRMPPSGERAVTLRGGWFPLAAQYSGAIAKIERLDADGVVAGAQSGFLIDGSLVRGGDRQAYLLVPAFLPPREGEGAFAAGDPPGIVSGDLSREPGEIDADAPDMVQKIVFSGGAGPAAGLRALFPALDGEAWTAGRDIVWQTPAHLGGVTPFELWQLDGPPPFAARPLLQEDVACAALRGPDEPANTPGRPLALYGIGDAAAGGQSVTLFVSSLEDAGDPYRIFYEHSTTLGASGAPVFDLTSGQVVAVHLGSERSAAPGAPRRGFGIALALILEGIRQEIDPGDDEPLGLLCEP